MTVTTTTGIAFIPEEGKRYLIHFGSITYKGQYGNVSAQIEVVGDRWIDLDTEIDLDPELFRHMRKLR